MLVLLTAACSRAPAENKAQIGNVAAVEVPDAPVRNAAVVDNAVTPEVAVVTENAAVPDLPADETIAENAQGAVPFPDEVTDFMVARDSCDHFRGEEPYDSERRAYLDENIRTLCTGTDVKLAVLRKRYAKDADVISALKDYEKTIEMPPQE